MAALKVVTKVQEEELSEKESHLTIKGREMENLQKLKKSLIKQHRKLKSEKNALETKVETVSSMHIHIKVTYLCIYVCVCVCVYVRAYVCVHVCHRRRNLFRTEGELFEILRLIYVYRENHNPME